MSSQGILSITGKEENKDFMSFCNPLPTPIATINHSLTSASTKTSSQWRSVYLISFYQIYLVQVSIKYYKPNSKQDKVKSEKTK
jgi:hypothetical protein